MEHAVIVGLGNPGAQYAHTRHNIGREAVVALAAECGVHEWEYIDGVGDVARGFVVQIPVAFVLPGRYMNRSGEALAAFGITQTNLEELIVVHDDLDLPLGEVRISHNRGHGGHRGISSIIDTFETRAFTRVRIGIVPRSILGTLKKPTDVNGVSTFVLAPFRVREKRRVQTAIARAASAARAIVVDGRERAMQVCNATR